MGNEKLNTHTQAFLSVLSGSSNGIYKYSLHTLDNFDQSHWSGFLLLTADDVGLSHAADFVVAQQAYVVLK